MQIVIFLRLKNLCDVFSSDKTLIHSELTILRSGSHITLKIWFILAGFFFEKSTYLQFHTIKLEIEKIVKKQPIQAGL
jgi:hypothetical protein